MSRSFKMGFTQGYLVGMLAGIACAACIFFGWV